MDPADVEFVKKTFAANHTFLSRSALDNSFKHQTTLLSFLKVSAPNSWKLNELLWLGVDLPEKMRVRVDLGNNKIIPATLQSNETIGSLKKRIAAQDQEGLNNSDLIRLVYISQNGNIRLELSNNEATIGHYGIKSDSLIRCFSDTTMARAGNGSQVKRGYGDMSGSSDSGYSSGPSYDTNNNSSNNNKRHRSEPSSESHIMSVQQQQQQARGQNADGGALWEVLQHMASAKNLKLSPDVVKQVKSALTVLFCEILTKIVPIADCRLDKLANSVKTTTHSYPLKQQQLLTQHEVAQETKKIRDHDEQVLAAARSGASDVSEEVLAKRREIAALEAAAKLEEERWISKNKELVALGNPPIVRPASFGRLIPPTRHLPPSSAFANPSPPVDLQTITLNDLVFLLSSDSRWCHGLPYNGRQVTVQAWAQKLIADAGARKDGLSAPFA